MGFRVVASPLQNATRSAVDGQLKYNKKATRPEFYCRNEYITRCMHTVWYAYSHHTVDALHVQQKTPYIHQTSIIVLAQQSDSISTLNLKYSRLVKLRTVDGSAVEAGVWTGYHHHLSDLGMIHKYGVNPIRFGQMLAEDTTYIAYEDTRNAQERR